MNIIKKFFYRTYQTAFRILLPMLPYRQPQILASNSEVCKVLQSQGISKVLLVTDGGLSALGLHNPLMAELKKHKISTTVYDGTVPNPTSKNVGDALNLYYKHNCQALIAFGGGSPMDCAKAVGARIAYPDKALSDLKGLLKVRKKLPLLIAVPTTAGTGSETTLAAVITDNHSRHKYTINSFPLIPSYALLDASLTLGLPKHITSTTGMDALTHAIEAYIGRSTTKFTRQCALDAVKSIIENIEVAYNDGKNIEARTQMLNASYKAGVAFTMSYVGYVHAIAHALGGKYNIAHGLANAMILPLMLRKYGKSIHKKLWQLAVYANLAKESCSYAEGAEIFISHIEKLNNSFQIPKTLPQIEMDDIRELAKTAIREANPLYPVPVLYESKDLESIFYALSNL